jgi:lysophospholipase L1-like esterase
MRLLVAGFVLLSGSSCAIGPGPSAPGSTSIGPGSSTAGEPSTSAPAGSPVSTASAGPSAGPTVAARTFVVLGDSLSAWAFPPGSYTPSTEGAWPLLLAAKDPGLVLAKNVGVPGNTTAQMLSRLQTDVLDLNPDLLFVLGGTNDIGYSMPVSVPVANIKQIVETAKGDGITVVLLNVPPADVHVGAMREAKVELNADLADLARQEGILLVDVYSALSTPDGDMAAGFAAADGLHLSLLGEKTLADTVEAALHSK